MYLIDAVYFLFVYEYISHVPTNPIPSRPNPPQLNRPGRVRADLPLRQLLLRKVRGAELDTHSGIDLRAMNMDRTTTLQMEI